MKKIYGLALVIVASVMLTSCFKDNQPVFDTLYVVEFQDATVTAPALNKTFPILTVANGVGAQSKRVNLVGRQRATEESIKFSVDPTETTAKEGVHYSLEGGVVKIPANSSFGDCKINILKAPTAAGTSVQLVLVLEGNGTDVKANENYKKLGFKINL